MGIDRIGVCECMDSNERCGEERQTTNKQKKESAHVGVSDTVSWGLALTAIQVCLSPVFGTAEKR
jgi:hypothetical protein